jgi:hypothetical protein
MPPLIHTDPFAQIAVKVMTLVLGRARRTALQMSPRWMTLTLNKQARYSKSNSMRTNRLWIKILRAQ